MFINNSRHHIMPFGKVRIFPGDNELTAEQVKDLKPYEQGLQSAIRAGWLTVTKRPIENFREDTSDSQMEALFNASEEAPKEEPAPVADAKAAVAEAGPDTSGVDSDFAAELAKRMRGDSEE